MVSYIIKNINWVDISFVILLLLVCYIAVKNGFPGETFKLFGTITALYLSLHYYIIVSAFIRGRLGIEGNGLQRLDFFVFTAILLLVHLFFALLRKFFSKALKVEALPTLNKWGGFILGLARGLVLGSLIMFMLLLSGVNFLKKGVEESYSGRYIEGIAPAVYSSLWHGFFSKLFSGEKFNENTINIWQP